MNTNKKELHDLKSQGAIKVKGVLNLDEVEAVKNIFLKTSNRFHNLDTRFPVTLKNFAIKFLKLDSLKIKDGLKLIELSRKKKLNNLSNNFFGKRSKLCMIDGYLAEKSNKNIIDWHIDQPYYNDNRDSNRRNNHDNRNLKIFIYLTDVNSNNGCLAYIPKSHKVSYCVKKMIFEKKIAQKPFKQLSECREFIMNKKNYNKILEEFEDEEELLNFLEITKFSKNSGDTQSFDYSMKAGGALIFDENIFHRGGKPSVSNRMVMRYHYSAHKLSANPLLS